MFEHSTKPRVFFLPPGCHFAEEFVAGLISRMANTEPAAMAQVRIHANTASLRRAITEAFIAQGNTFIPRIRLLTEFATDPDFPNIPGPVSRLVRELELAEATSALLDRDKRFAPRSTTYELATSLARLMDEMHDRNIRPDRLRQLDLTSHSAHWDQSLRFINIIDRYWRATSVPDANARQRLVVEAQLERWRREPPSHPVIVAGSTGSQATTLMFMKAVASLPQGALLLPCFDNELPPAAWQMLDSPATSESHPQYRFVELAEELGIDLADVAPWRRQTRVDRNRNRLVSLALRPAPVTDQWLNEGSRLTGLSEAARGLTLIEASSPREEAEAIAVRMRAAVHENQSIGLVTPDRQLVMRVKAALKRWNLVPQDSVGDPFTRTPQGRFLVQIGNLMGRRAGLGDIFSLLKNPLTNSADQRSQHVRIVRRMETDVRRQGPEFDPLQQLEKWAGRRGRDSRAKALFTWYERLFRRLAAVATMPFAQMVHVHMEFAEAFAATPNGSPSELLWRRDMAAARRAAQLMKELTDNTGNLGAISPMDYASIFFGVASGVRVTEPYRSHPLLAVWNTEDVRMQRPDIVIAGGLNEGSWPVHISQDAWLNRNLRLQLGLTSPERRVGLAAHDFQQAISLPVVVLARSKRGAETTNIACRWLSRLVGLLAGLGPEGEQALADMRSRGNRWIGLAEALNRPKERVEPAARPCPAPPAAVRPKRLSVTEINTLNTDPYAIYARHVLNLWPLLELSADTGPRIRGIRMHALMAEFAKRFDNMSPEEGQQLLLSLARRHFSGTGAPPFAERLWQGQFEKLAGELASLEVTLRSKGEPEELECIGEHLFEELEFTLTGRVDRLDLSDNEELSVFDYKTGQIPAKSRMKEWDKQLQLLAALAQLGAFTGGHLGDVCAAGYVGIGSKLEFRTISDTADSSDLIAEVLQELQTVIGHYSSESSGYLSRRIPRDTPFETQYNHLARFGEWDDTSPASAARLK
ncbi:MAG: double-strand break repair protein AddB [Rhodobacteraceae bacterium]|nr:double-strand break repair protein AddB [Paracoccaceae bacterium]